MGTPEHDVFLSHNSSDKPAVEELARRLAAQRISPWLDKWNLIPGVPWQPAIEEALWECKTCAVFIGPSGFSPWQNEEMRAAINRRVSMGGFRVIPVLLPGGQRGERGRLPEFLVATTWVEFLKSLDDDEAFRRLICGIRGIEPGPGLGTPIITGVRPYRGLETFQPEHAAFFFGREALTGWLVDKLGKKPGQKEANRFLAIIGASGSGKSSLARAGLIPAIKNGAIEGSQNWPLLIMRPGADPLESLAIALRSYSDVRKFVPPTIKEIITQLKGDSRQLHWTVSTVLHETPESQRVFILIDQFEEIFTLCQNDELQLAFIENILYAANVSNGRTIAVLTMRADFIARCLKHKKFCTALSDHQFLVGPMNDQELRKAIEFPARLVGCELEPDLTESLIYDFKNRPGALPLLQHALYELWKRRKDRRLTLDDYEGIGRLEGALEGYANSVYEKFDEPKKKICQGVFLRLIQPGEGTEDTKRRASMKDLVSSEAEAEAVSLVVKELADSRLVTTEGDKAKQEEGVVEIAHETLIRGWSKLRGWIDSDRQGLRIHRRLSDSAAEWDKSGRDENYLFRGTRLAEAMEWMSVSHPKLTFIESSFIETSTRQEKAQKSKRRLKNIGLLVLAFAVLGVLAILFYDAEQQKKISQREAYNAQLSRVSSIWMRDPDFALKLLDDTSRVPKDLKDFSWGILHRSAKSLKKMLTSHSSSVLSVAFSPDGKTLASASADETVRLWDMVALDKEPAILSGHKGSVFSVAFSPDGKTLASASADETVSLWDLALDKERAILSGHKGSVLSVAFSPDGETLASASRDGTVKLWNAQSGQERATLTCTGLPVTFVVFSLDSKILFSSCENTTENTTLKLWEVKSGHELTSLTGHDGMVTSLAVSADRKTLASASRDKTIILWSGPMGQERATLTGHSGHVTSVAFSPDRETIASASRDETIILWDLVSGKEPVTLTGHSGHVTSVAFSPDGKTLASASADKTVRLWDMVTLHKEPAILSGHKGTVWSVAFSPDGKTLASTSEDKTVKLWDVDSPKERATLVHKESVNLVAFSTDGKTLASATDDKTVILWDVAKGEEIYSLKGHRDSVSSVSFSSDAKTLASASRDCNVSLWDASSRQERVILLGQNGPALSVAFSPDGKTLATAYEYGTIKLWDATNGRERAILTGHDCIVWSVAFSPDSKILVSASGDMTIKIWDASIE